jgi:hypothetical protein
MPSDPRDIKGNWYGLMVHTPSRSVIHVEVFPENGSFKGKWDLPSLTRGALKKGAFTAARFGDWLTVRVKTKPLASVVFQLTIVVDKGQSMITGVIPIEKAEIPFATITLFRKPPATRELTDGICPDDEFPF